MTDDGAQAASDVPVALRQFRHEHARIATLLDILEAELALFADAGQPDYDVFTAIAEYFTDFPDRCHHPREEVLFRRLKARDPSAADIVATLAVDHEALGNLARNFQQAVENVLADMDVPREAFHRVVSHFIERQRRHLQYEEEVAFPAALRSLSIEDWLAIDEGRAEEKDSLFDKDSDRRFENLRQLILAWEKADSVARAAATSKEYD